MVKKLTLNEVIDKCKIKHENMFFYNFELIQKTYKNTSSNLIINCNIHGDFIQVAKNHMGGQGCPACAIKKRKQLFLCSEKDFLKKAIIVHGLKYGYSKINYLGAHKDIIIRCFMHGDFIQKPYIHLQNHGCPKCGIKIAHEQTKLSQKQFKEKAAIQHNNFYSYCKSIYIDYKNKLIITCPIHGDFEQKAGEHLHGYGCLKCGYDKSKHVRVSKGQQKLFETIKNNCDRNTIMEKYIQLNDDNFCYADIFIPKINAIIEYYGDYWHCNPDRYKSCYWHPHKKMHAKDVWQQDLQRQKDLEKLGYKVCIIWENELKNNEDKILKKLFNLFNK